MSDRAFRAPRARPVVLVAVGAALSAVGLGGQGLLVPAGPDIVGVRLLGAAIALTAVGVLLRLDGPARGTRTLAVVAVVGACTGLATLPASPVGFLHAADPPGASAGTPAEDGTGTAVFEQPGAGAPTDPAAPPPGGTPVPGAMATPPASGGGTPVGGDAGAAAPPAGSPGAGTAATVPAPLPAPETAAPDQPQLAEGVDGVLALLLASFALLAFAPPIVRVADRFTAPLLAEPTDPPAEPTMTPALVMEAGLSDALRAMLADPDPRTAVIGAYAGLLEALAAAGEPRLPAETPHEHLWRALGSLGVRRAPLHRLAELFVQARFTPRPLTDEHRQAAINALADAVADLRLPASPVAEIVGAAP